MILDACTRVVDCQALLYKTLAWIFHLFFGNIAWLLKGSALIADPVHAVLPKIRNVYRRLLIQIIPTLAAFLLVECTVE